MSGTMASILFIHGASSSGKSTLARAVQRRISAPFWHISIDHLRDSGLLPLDRVKAGDFDWKAMRAPFFDGFHRSLAAYASAGNNLILEHILDTPGWHEELAVLFAPYDVLFIGLHTDLEELKRREVARGDRPLGSAEEDFQTIHKGLSYDLELSSHDPLDDNVARVLSAWQSPERGRAFFHVPTKE